MADEILAAAARGAQYLDRVADPNTPKARGNGKSDAPSSTPQPLPKIPPVPEFPDEILPDAIRPWICDCASRARFRPDFAAVAAMCALGSLAGRKLGIRLKRRDDWTEYANVWGMLIGPPSALKSPAMREALRPFKALQSAIDEQHDKALRAYKFELEAHKLRKDSHKTALKKALSKDPSAAIDFEQAAEPIAPIARTYWTSDATAEKLGVLLAENPNGLLVERDELSSFLATLDDERNSTARGLYLAGWSGKEGYRFDRIMRGVTFIPKFALSIVGGIQPGPLLRYVREAYSGERADGLLQRFQLAVWPDPGSFEYVDRYPDGAAKRAAFDLFRRMDEFDATSIGRRDEFGDDPPYIHLSDAAQEIFIDWYTKFMSARRAEENSESGGALANHLGKFPGLLGKLALITHLADEPTKGEVSERTLLKALAWLQFLEPHANRIYFAVEHPETGAAELLLARLKRGELTSGFKPRDVYRKCWHGLTDKTAIHRACALLHDFGWLDRIQIENGPGRRPDPVFVLTEGAKAML